MDAKARAVYDACPPELKTWLLPRIAAPLRRQLRAMWKPSVFGSFFPNGEFRNDVLEVVVTERNNVAHGSLGRSSHRLSGEQL